MGRQVEAVAGQARQWWGEITDQDLDRVAGKSDQLVGLLQMRYGYTRVHAEQEFNKRMAEYAAHEPHNGKPIG